MRMRSEVWIFARIGVSSISGMHTATYDKYGQCNSIQKIANYHVFRTCCLFVLYFVFYALFFLFVVMLPEPYFRILVGPRDKILFPLQGTLGLEHN